MIFSYQIISLYVSVIWKQIWIYTVNPISDPYPISLHLYFIIFYYIAKNGATHGLEGAVNNPPQPPTHAKNLRLYLCFEQFFLIKYLLNLFELTHCPSPHGSKSQSRPLTRWALRWIDRGDSNRSRAIRAKNNIEISKNSKKITINL